MIFLRCPMGHRRNSSWRCLRRHRINVFINSCWARDSAVGYHGIKPNPPLRSPPATSRFMVLRFWKFEFRILHKGFEIFHISPKVENVVLRFLLNLKIWFRDFQKFSRLRRANWCIFKGNRWFAPKIPKIFRLRRENLRPGFEIFRKFQNFVTNVFEIFQNFPNLESSF